MDFHAWSAEQIKTSMLPGPAAVVRMADSAGQLATIKDQGNVVAQLDILFNDTEGDYGIVRAPRLEDARRILDFAAASRVPHFVAQCQVGRGRSHAVVAALAKLHGIDASAVLRYGTYNRRLHQLLLDAAGLPPTPLALISLAVRVKYPAERLHLFLLSMRRQRHTNWEVIAVTDGPNPDARNLVNSLGDTRIRLIETAEPRGRWGHPYRQLGMDACRGEFIGMSNDDNYYVPGYLEQMVFAIESAGADMATCQVLHSYAGWSVITCEDVGCWIARRELVRKYPWPGQEFYSDRDYFYSLTAEAKKVVEVPRALFVHN